MGLRIQKEFFFEKLIPPVVVVLFVILPIFSLNYDMWDGAVIEYASIINNSDGLRIWFYESAWFLQYWFVKSLINVYQLTGIPYQVSNAFCMGLSIILLLREVAFLAAFGEKEDKTHLLLAKLLVCSSPILAAFLSSVMTFHLVCTTFGLIAVRLIHSGKKINLISGYLLLLPCFNFSGLLAFLPCLSFYLDNFKQIRIKRSYPGKNTITIFLCAILYYGTVQFFFPPHNDYESYNSIVKMNSDGLWKVFKQTIKFSTFLLPLIVIVFVLNFLKIDVPKILSSDRFQSVSFPIALLLLLLCFSAIFPYVMVGKGTVYFRVNDWDIRHAVPLMVPLSLLYAHILREIKLFDTAINKDLKYWVFGTMILLANVVILTFSSSVKINRDNFTKAFGDKIVSIYPDLPSARIKITGAGIPKPEIRSYESNYLFYNSYGSANRWVKFIYSGSVYKPIFVVPDFVKNSQAYQDLYVYKYNDVHDTRCLHIEIDVLGYAGFQNVIQNFTFRNNKKTIEIVQMKEC